MSDFCYAFPVFHRVLAQAELMDRMMRQAGIEPLSVIRFDQGATWFEARTRCIECLHDKQCRAWLDTAHASVPSPVPDECPNSSLFNMFVNHKPH